MCHSKCKGCIRGCNLTLRLRCHGIIDDSDDSLSRVRPESQLTHGLDHGSTTLARLKLCFVLRLRLRPGHSSNVQVRHRSHRYLVLPKPMSDHWELLACESTSILAPTATPSLPTWFASPMDHGVFHCRYVPLAQATSHHLYCAKKFTLSSVPSVGRDLRASSLSSCTAFSQRLSRMAPHLGFPYMTVGRHGCRIHCIERCSSLSRHAERKVI